MKLTIQTPFGFSEAGKSGNNEDAIYPNVGTAQPESRLFIVCDGIGGAHKGKAASQIVCNAFKEYFTEINPPKKKKAGPLYINEALRYAERKMQQHLQEFPDKHGMRSSVALIYFGDNNQVTIAWAGTARGYHIREKKILYKTEDHLVTLRERGENTVIPRAISGLDPVWASATIIDKAEPGDYFLLTTQGVSETFDERNLKYLLSQGDGTDDTNEAIAEKMKELCGQNSRSDSTMYLIQAGQKKAVSTTSANNKKNNAGKEVKETLATTGAGGVTTPTKETTDKTAIVVDKTPKSTTRKTIQVGKISRNPKDSSGIPDSGSPGKAILAALLILLLVGAALAYKYTTSKPEDIFLGHVEKGNLSLQKRDYTNAIAAFQDALAVKMEDTSAFTNVRQKLRNAKEQMLIQQGDRMFRDEKWVQARNKYREVLGINAQNGPIRQKIDYIGNMLGNLKLNLLTKADSLLKLEKFDDAKRFLYEALYIDQKNEDILALINDCNSKLEKTEVTLDLAVQQAIRFDSLGYQEPKQVLEVDPPPVTETPTEVAQNTSKPKPDEKPLAPPLESPTYTKPTVTTPVKPKAPSKYDKLISEGDAALGNGDFSTAKAKFKAALTIEGSKDLETKIAKCESELDKKAYNKMIKAADRAYDNKEYDEAKKYYELALSHQSDDNYAKKRIREAANKISSAEKQDLEYNQLLSEADQAFRKGNYATAKSKYQKALQYTSNTTSINKKIAECNRAISQMEGGSSRKKIKRAEKLCKSKNYNGECYAHLKENNMLYSMDAKLLYRIGQALETRDAAKAKECFTISASKNYSPAKEKIK